MTKQKINYRCTNCNYISFKWLGCCPACKEWNSFSEEFIFTGKDAQDNKTGSRSVSQCNLVTLDNVNTQTHQRMTSGIKEWDRVLGGGILPGSFLILTGDPGIGKSTLLLQVADKLANNYKIFYFSSEESLQQVKTRAIRLNLGNSTLLFSDDSYLDGIINACEQQKPDLIIIDSIQNCHISPQRHSFPGTIAQLREAGFLLMRFAKENNISVLITGHITKEGQMAGPKVLEHMVDAVFYLQGEDRWHTRILRAVKNRFGTINEVGFFEMQETGMIEITNINQHLISTNLQTPGASLVCCVEGTRPILFELQALCVESKFGLPQRVITGVDHKQVVIIAAILEKYLHIKFSMHDIFFKVSGGFKIKESSVDLGIALALLSSYFQIALPNKSVSIAEVSLTGQIKTTNQVNTCIKEIEKFGLENIFIAHAQHVNTSCNVSRFKNVYELLQLFPEK